MPSETRKDEDRLKEIERLLDGIDRIESDDDGWWETSAGAEKGTEIIAAIRALF